MALANRRIFDVANVNGSSGSHFRASPEDGSSWLAAWKKYKGVDAAEGIKCANYRCPDKRPNATDGGHTRKIKDDDRSIYIVPLCHRCNCSNKPLRVDEYNLVPLAEL